jgi:hypothetical protein
MTEFQDALASDFAHVLKKDSLRNKQLAGGIRAFKGRNRASKNDQGHFFMVAATRRGSKEKGRAATAKESREEVPGRVHSNVAFTTKSRGSMRIVRS